MWYVILIIKSDHKEIQNTLTWVSDGLFTLTYNLTVICYFLFSQRLTAYLHSKKSPPYVINLDPAVHEVPFPANIGMSLLLFYRAGSRARLTLRARVSTVAVT